MLYAKKAIFNAKTMDIKQIQDFCPKCCKRIRMELEIGYPEHFVLWITESLAHTNSSQQPFSKNSELLCSCALKIQSSCAPT